MESKKPELYTYIPRISLKEPSQNLIWAVNGLFRHQSSFWMTSKRFVKEE